MAPSPATREEKAAALSEEEEEMQSDQEEAPSHLPFAPPEFLDVSTTIDPSYIISLIRQLLPHDPMMEKQLRKSEDSTASMTDNEMNKEVSIEEKNGGSDVGSLVSEKAKDPWEESGCILWDLAASRTHAELMVKNFVLEVLLANIQASRSFRITEICLGIIGNLSCHEALRSAIVSTHGVVEAVIDQLFLDDSACLSETFRVLTVSLQGSSFASWAEALLPDQVLLRILWIVENTLNPTLLEKSIEFLLAISGNEEVSSFVLEPLMKLGLANLIVSLLACQISKLRDDVTEERLSSLDLILQVIEALSATDNYSKAISSNVELFDLVCGVVKLLDKVEASSSCVSAVVCIANLLADDSHLTSRLSNDLQFLEGLLEILPYVSEDSQARDALWCILQRMLAPVEDTAKLRKLASIFLEKSHIIEEDLDGHPVNNLCEDATTVEAAAKPSALATSLRKIAFILEKWRTEESSSSEKVESNGKDDGKAQKLLAYCQKHGSFNLL